MHPTAQPTRLLPSQTRMINASAEIAERSLSAADDAVQPMIAAASTTETKVMKKAA